MAKETTKRVNIWINGKEVENNVKSIRSAMSQLTNQLNKMEIGSAEYIETSKKLRELKGIYDEHCKSLRLTNNEYHVLSSNLKENILVTGGAAAVIQTASKAVQSFVAATQEYVQAYATLDDAMTNVSKYTGLTREEVKQLNEEFQKMDTRTPTEKLNALAADAGRLGITFKEAIKDFVEAADIINVALGEDLGEDAVKNIGKMAQMFGESENLGLRGAMLATASAVNTLAQSSSASEPYIMEVSSRLAGVANAAGMTQAQIMGLASALDQNMAQAEKSATALQKFILGMTSATGKYAEIAGMSVEQFRKVMEQDMNQALVSVIDGFKRIQDTGGISALNEALDELKLKGSGIKETLTSLVMHTDQLKEAQQLATAAYADGNSVISEAAAVNGNAAAQLEKAKKAVEDAKATLGEELMPIIIQITQAGASGLQIAKEVVKFVTQHKGLVIALASAYGALLLAQKAVNAAQKEGHAFTLKNMAAGKAYRSVVFLLTAAKAKLAGATGAATLAQKQFKAAFASTPWGAIIVAIGAVVGGIVKLVEKHREASKAAEEFNEACSKEQAEAEYLFQKLKKAEKGTEDYKKALQRLKEKYPEVIQKHIDEAGAIRDIEQAYKDVIRSIESKIAIQMKEQAVTEALTDKLDKYKNFLSELREEAIAQGLSQSAADDIVNTARTKIDQLVEDGRTSVEVVRRTEEELTKLGFNAYRNERGYFSATAHALIWEMTNASNKAKSAISGISQQFDVFIDHVEAAGNEAKEEIEGNRSTDNTGGGDVDDKVLKKREAFQKRLAQMQQKEQLDLLSGWEKTKQQIVNQYAEMEAEAAELYGKNSKMLEQVQAQRDQAIATAGQKYIQDTSKVLDDAAKKIEEWQKDVNPGSGNEILDKLLGKKTEWVKRASDLQTHLETLRDTRRQFIADNVDTSAIDAEITRTEDYLAKISTMKVADLKQFLEQYQKEVSSFITTEQKDLTNSTLTETQRQKAAITEKYQLEIELIEKLKAARRQDLGEDADISDLEEQINKLIDLRDKLLANVDRQYSGGLQGKNIWQQLAEFDWKNMGDNWQQGIDLMTNSLNEFANTAFSIFNSISQMQSNAAQAEFEAYTEAQDKKSKSLKKQLDSGLISQAKYDAEVAKMEEEKAKKEKEMKHEQFEREKTANIIQTIISGAAAAATTLAQWGVPWGLIPMGIALAMTAVETALIASQPNPYARGGFIRGKQIAMMGEEGDEWVASHMLLSDKKTAPVISALEKYQQGDSRALDLLSVPEPSWEKLQQSSRKLSRTFATSTPVNNYSYTTNNTNTASSNLSELLAETKKMNQFLKDPKNRQAVISRKIQLEFERFEDDVRQRARL